MEAKTERMRCISAAVRHHHEQHFGKVGWTRLATKLGEEVGELQGAIIRDTEQRDARPWKNEMYEEIQDVLTVLHVMCSRMGQELSYVSDDGSADRQARRPSAYPLPIRTG